MDEKDKKLVRSLIDKLRRSEMSYDIETMTATDYEQALALERLLEEVENAEE